MLHFHEGDSRAPAQLEKYLTSLNETIQYRLITGNKIFNLSHFETLWFGLMACLSLAVKFRFTCNILSKGCTYIPALGMT